MEDLKRAWSSLNSKAKGIADLIYSVGKKTPIRIITHIDADGLCAGGLIARALKRLRVPFHLSSVKFLSKDLISEIMSEEYGLFVYLDLGAGYLNEIQGTLSSENKKVLILDHHPPVKIQTDFFIILNPFEHGINGSYEISGAGVVYLVYRHLVGGDDDGIVMAITGALGDQQVSEDGFAGINSMLVELGKKLGFIEVKRDLRLFGGADYPLVPALQRTYDLVLLGLFQEAKEAVNLLERLNIPLKAGDRAIRLSDLTTEQKRELFNEIVKQIVSKGKGGLSALTNLFGDVYIAISEPVGSPTRELNGFSTLLNACGRMGRPDLGIALAMGLRGSILESALQTLTDYRKTLAKVLSQIMEDSSGLVRREEGILFLLGGDEIRDTMIGTITSIISKSRFSKEYFMVVGLTKSEAVVKVSARLTDAGVRAGINLDDLMRKSCVRVGGIGGGHKHA
ncbi:MAG TPA: DHH family phosphoesterase, partial [Candidatus Korarchaeota archaeon]|nr:DHH family phosphoesterase [Candidatus Korarchaeota archaeon]